MITMVNPVWQTAVFAAALFLLILVSLAKKNPAPFFSRDTTLELKGFAILAIILSHIGYFLAADHRFLFPLSVMAGVGVDLFLFLSGFGLTISALAHPLSPRRFYAKRLTKLYVPLWIVLATLFCVDALARGIHYSWTTIISSFLGIFTSADIYHDLNAPLWYFTFIVGFYLTFPLVFSKKYPWASAATVAVEAWLTAQWLPSSVYGVVGFYRLHFAAFPLGMLAAWLVAELRPYFGRTAAWRLRWKPWIQWIMRGILLFALAGGIAYFGLHAPVGGPYQQAQLVSLATLLMVVAFFLLLPLRIGLLVLLGEYSYEIYLIHWPLLYRYDIIYALLPAWAATLCWLAIFAGAGWLLHKLSHALLQRMQLRV